ncbi:hypothetical protein CW712_04685 [Candidatus Bathyarchaeota archaeon]|nr:MAG: hypothetical protein CW712_04685 [Candidatus Bathyarchaeota archaeon]
MLRPSLIAFIALLIGCTLTSFGILQYTLSAHIKGDYILLENDYLALEFPKDWLAFSWIDHNLAAGKSYSALFASPHIFSVMMFRVYDQAATQSYMQKNNLTDTLSVVIFEASRIYNWSLENNKNATLVFLENGTITVSDHTALYSSFLIRDGFKQDGKLYNLTCMFISYVSNQKLVQVVFWGKEDDCRQTRDIFNTVLSSTKVKI